MKFEPKREGVLYHYTSHEALYNIVENNNLRATHVYYLNDSNEIIFALDKFVRIVNQRKKDERDKRKLIIMEQLPNWLQNMKNNPHFIFSFSLSEDGNLLSQWRAYTPYGTGVSIGFCTEDLEKFAAQKSLKLIRCEYKVATHTKILNELLDQILDKFELEHSSIDTSKKHEGQEYHNYLNKFTEAILDEFVKIKDHSFKEEREWRLVSRFYESYQHQDINFRIGKSTLVPFIEYKIKDIRSDGYLFEQVYVGPSPNFSLSYHAIVAYLSNKKACNMTINSQLSLREV